MGAALKLRAEALGCIADKDFDVCVIGGGATGSGCALDSQLRGLRSVLLEGADFASASSSASTKIVHGGVRYLQQAVRSLDYRQLRVLRSALRERALMLANAPFLARPLEFLIPCFSWFDAFYYGFGLKVYDWIAGRAVLSPSGFLSRDASLERIPSLKLDRLRGTVVYTDGGFDDARYCITLVSTFADAGGKALNYARVVGFEKDQHGMLSAAVVEDQLTQQRFAVRAKAFVNATGAFADNVRELATPAVGKRMRPSKGVHILLPLDGSFGRDALLIPSTEDGRVVFAIPWLGRLLIGTTDDEATLAEEPLVKEMEVEYLLRHLNRYLQKPFSIHQVVSGFAGLRPLVNSGDARNTSKLARDHEVELDPQSGLISILGGKWTTYRLMAEDTINAVQKFLQAPVTKCVTRNYALAGSAGYESSYWQTLVDKYGVTSSAAHHLAGKFGAKSNAILDLAMNYPELAQPVVEGLAPIRAEVVYSIRNEMALHIEDILDRRIGLQLYSWSDAIKAAPIVATLLSQELGWTASQTEEAVGQYVEKIKQRTKTAGLRV